MSQPFEFNTQALNASQEQAVRPTIAVLIPAYGHAGLLAEAIHSVSLTQDLDADVPIVVAVDGDPAQEVADVLFCEASANPYLHVIFGCNGGPGAARNRAIQYALDTFSALEAIYFLDADNRLLPMTLSKLWADLRRSKAGWVYTNIDAFSVPWTGHYGDEYSALRHCITDNICDTGSMVSVRVLRDGIRFNEDRENGFEDWDFWLTCIEGGYKGSKCSDAAFEYRLRAESRFREVERQRASSVAFLRKRHKKLFRRDHLVDLEHQEAPRYALRPNEGGPLQLFTDAFQEPTLWEPIDAASNYWVSVAEPDNFHYPPFIAVCSNETFEVLKASPVLANLLGHCERLAERRNVVLVNLVNDCDQVSIEISENEPGYLKEVPADLVFIRTALLTDIFRDNAVDWLSSITTHQIWPTTAVITVRIPLPRQKRRARLSAAEQALVNFVGLISSSALRTVADKRWTWRQQILVPYRDLHFSLRTELNGNPVLPIGRRAKKTAAILTPIASFGGAEKVAFAAARALKEEGYETHIFVLGAQKLAIQDSFFPYFDYIHFWPEVPQWGSSNKFVGHDFINETASIDWSLLRGQLSGFNVVINNHVLAAHALMGWLRSYGSRTICYLHVIDHTKVGRPAGQPFAAIAHEHAYDMFVTCSEQLKTYLQGYGVGHRKIIAVKNGPGFLLSNLQVGELKALRLNRLKGPLRLLYFGRLDVQKGIDRLYGTFRELSERGIVYEARVVGSELLRDGGVDWTTRLSAYAEIHPPAYRTAEILKHLSWADALLLTSRWEGAPLVIPEAQSTGCVPIATCVGAVEEQIVDAYDGLLIFAKSDQEVVSGMVEAVIRLQDFDVLRYMSTSSFKTADVNSWQHNFEQLLEWLRQ